MTWYNAGTRNFYATTPIYTPDDLKGLKIRVQQSPASVKMVQAFGAAATPLSFGDVYTAIQQHVIDGAENNELALTNNKHGEVAKYFSYTKAPDGAGYAGWQPEIPEQPVRGRAGCLRRRAARLSTGGRAFLLG